MAMGQLPHSDTDLESDGVFSEINITPLTDVILVLLIIFMVTSTVITHPGSGGTRTGLKVNLPKGAAADVSSSGEEISIAVLSDGRLALAGDVVSAEELKDQLKVLREKNPSALVIIQADEGVPHGKVVEVMEQVKTAGLSQLAIGVREGP